MKKVDKHYILKRSNNVLIDSYLFDVSDNDKRNAILKRIDYSLPLLLIEIVRNNDNESVNNLWTINEGCSILWTKYTKDMLMYDYTGVYSPLIHINGRVYTWDDYKK